MKPSIVSIVECDEYEESALERALRGALQPFGGWGELIRPGTGALLKPNFIRALPVERQAITHPALLCAVAGIVKSLGARPVVGDSPAFGSMKTIMALPGMRERFLAAGLDTCSFHRGRSLRLPECGLRGIRIAREIDEFDTLINIPKLKAHCQVVYSGAVKNLFGCIRGRTKAFQHFRVGGDRLRFGLMLAELARTILPDLTVVDAVMGMDRTGPSLGDPFSYGVLIAGTDPFAIDYVLADLFGIEWQRVPVLQAAGDAGFFQPGNVKCMIEGDADAIRERFRAARLPDELIPITFTLPRLAKGLVRHVKESCGLGSP